MDYLVLLIVLPLLAAFMQSLVSRQMPAMESKWGPLVLLLTSLLGLSAWTAVGQQAVVLYLGGFKAPVGITLYIDQLGLLFAIIVSVSILWLWPKPEQVTDSRQYTILLMLAAAANGLALSADLFNIYVFYELMTVASYGLIAAQSSRACLAATFRYLLISSVGSVLALLGISLIYMATGTLNLAHLAQLAPAQLNNNLGLSAFVLLLLGFGVKAELFPVNSWVADVYATTSKRVSALLAGVISKLALLVILRLLTLIFYQDAAANVLLVLGALGVITGELAAWRAQVLTRVLAYSSIAQLGLVFIAFSLPSKLAILVGLAIILQHLLIKPAFFLLAEQWGGSLQRLNGIAKHSPIAAIFFIILALSLIGVPPFPGFWIKFLLLSHLAQQADGLAISAMVIILLAAVIEANYFFRIITRFYAMTEIKPLPQHHFREIASVFFIVVGLLGSLFFINPIMTKLHFIANQASQVDQYINVINPVVGG